MASKPHAPKTLEDKRSISKGFDLAAITDPIANLFNQYSTVQVKNGAQAVLLQRADNGGDSGAPAPVVGLTQAQGGTLSISSTGKAIGDATKATKLKQAQGLWAQIPKGAKIGIIAGGAGLLIVGGVYLYLR